MTKQQKWDCFLITSFYKRPGINMGMIINIFNDDIEGLKRTPIIEYQMYTACMPFICNCLHPLGDILFNKEISDAYDVAMTIPDSLVTSKKRYGVLQKEHRNKAYSDKKKYRASRIAISSERDHKNNSIDKFRGRMK